MRKSLRKLLSTLLVLAIILTWMPTTMITAQAADSNQCGDNLTWSLSEDGTLTISGTGSMYDYQYDSSIETTTVPWASQMASITSVVFEEGVTYIGNSALQLCSNVESVSIPNTVTAIGDSAIRGCESLTSLTIPNSVETIDDCAFGVATSLTSVTIPGSIKTMGVNVFHDCKALTTVVIEAGVETIGPGAFYWCENLTSVTIPDTVTVIDEAAFSLCTSLHDITIPISVNTIGNYAFNNCEQLTDVYYGGNAYQWESLIAGTEYNEPLTNATIHYTVEDDHQHSYRATVTAPTCEANGYTTYKCSCGDTYTDDIVATPGHSYTTETKSVTCTEYGGTIYTCDTCGDSYIDAKVNALGHDWGTGEITLEPTASSSGEKTYTCTRANCGQTRTVTLPATSADTSGTLENISWTLEDGVLTISGQGAIPLETGAWAPWRTYHDAIESVVIEEGITDTGYGAFLDCGNLVSVDLPDTFITIGDCSFCMCGVLESIEIPNNVTTIAYNAFAESGLQHVEFPSQLTTIGDYAFLSNYNLASVTIPESVTQIKESAFSNCPNLTDVYYDADETQWAAIEISYGNDSLTNATIHYATSEEITWTLSDEGTLTISGEGKLLWDTSLEWADQRESITALVVKEGITEIDSSTFDSLVNLTSVSLPNSLEIIGYNAFAYCRSLESITIPSGVTEIQTAAFYACDALKSFQVAAGNTAYTTDASGVLYNKAQTTLVCYPADAEAETFTIPATVTYLDSYAFAYNAALVSITIPETVTDMGHSVFYYCTDLVSVTIESDLTQLPDGTFSQCASLQSVTLPNSITSIGRMSFSECADLASLDLPDSLTQISEGALSGCSCLSSITIPATVTDIQAAAFQQCSNLTSVTMPDELTTINVQLFEGCTKLENITVPDGVVTIDVGAFMNCAALQTITLPGSLQKVAAYAFNQCGSLSKVIYDSNEAHWNGVLIEDGNSALTAADIEFSDTAESIETGTYGDNITWTFDWSTLTLTLSGSGDMLSLSEVTTLEGTEEDEENADIYDNVYQYASVRDEDAAYYSWRTFQYVTQNLVIEEGITSVGHSAFYQFPQLKNVTLPDGLTSIGHYAFSNTKLQSLSLPDSVNTLGGYAFANCHNITSLELSPIPVIEVGTFSGCSSLTTVTLPVGVERLLSNAFAKCTQLQTVNMAWSVIQLADTTFSECPNLATFNISTEQPSVFSTDESGCLYGDEGEILYFVPRSLTGHLTIPDGVKHVYCHFDYSQLSWLTYPEGVQTISSTYYGSQIVGLDIPTSVTTFNGTGFMGLTASHIALNFIYYAGTEAQWNELLSNNWLNGDFNAVIFNATSENHNQCGDNATWSFDAATGTLTISGTGAIYDYELGTDVAMNLYSNRTPWSIHANEITSVVVNSGITELGCGTFSSLPNLESVSLPDTLISIDAAFINCPKLTTLTIPDSVTSIHSAFQFCTGLQQISIPSSVTGMNGTFYGCTSLTDVTIAGDVSELSGTFHGCSQLQTVTLPESLTTIHDNTFTYSGLTNITIPASVTRIGNSAFRNCTELTTVTLAEGLQIIDMFAFDGCKKLQQIKIPASVTYIGDMAFNGCESATNYTVISDNPSYTSLDGVLYNDSQSQLLRCPAAQSGSFVVPDSVTEIAYYAFSSCTKLQSITLPDSVTSIAEGAFQNCSALKSINIPASVVSIGRLAFDGCDSLTDITVSEDSEAYASREGVLFNYDMTVLMRCPSDYGSAATDTPSALSSLIILYNHVVSALSDNSCSYSVLDDVLMISSHAFADCSNITTITIPASVESIAEDAFVNCANLQKIIVDQQNPYYATDDTGTLYNASKTALLHCPTAEAAAYTVPDTITTIGSYAFSSGDALTSVTLSDNITTLQSYAFAESNVTDIYYEGPIGMWQQISIDTYAIPDGVQIHYSSCVEHTPAEIAAIPATCTEPGSTAGSYCSNCDIPLTEPQPIPALGHSYDNGVITTQPTETTTGVKTYTCATCGDSYTEAVPATGETKQPFDPDAVPNPFGDVKKGAFYYNPVMWAISNGVTSGTSATTFGPNDSCTRGQVVTFLWRAAGCPAPKTTSCPFTDVSSSGFYYKAMMWAVENGVTSGTTATTFSPNAPCTRGQVVTFLYRAAGKPAVTTNKCAFTDVSSSGFYYKAMMWAVENGVTSGTTATTFAPNNTCTRGQVVTFLYRTYN